MNGARPQALTIAAVLLALLSMLKIVSIAIPAFSDGVPAVVAYGGGALGDLGLVAAYGLWRLKRWGVWLTILVSALNILSMAPGLAFSPAAVLPVAAVVTIVGFTFIVFLVIMPASRRAYA